jgi:hypothetical protein
VPFPWQAGQIDEVHSTQVCVVVSQLRLAQSVLDMQVEPMGWRHLPAAQWPLAQSKLAVHVMPLGLPLTHCPFAPHAWPVMHIPAEPTVKGVQVPTLPGRAQD